MRPLTLALIAVTVLLAFVAWPILDSGDRAHAAPPTPAPVMADYLFRDKTVAFYETRVRRDPADQISARMLAQQYMQRFREFGDINDVKRSIVQSRRSIQLQPGNNWGSYEILASAETALHLFRRALAHEQYAHRDQPHDTNAIAQMASLQMELGRYDVAGALVRPAAEQHPADAGLLAVLARYDELTGRLSDARAYLDRAGVIMDTGVDNSAQSRAWFHYRAGEMAFSAGDIDVAKKDERDALATFPNFAPAYNSLARFCWASKDWKCALDNATRGANIVPLPETLGYKADAERSLGKTSDAKRTEALLVAIERIGNAFHVSDRLLAVYYSEHGIRLDDALKIARREVSVRGEEIYAQDTLAWAAARDGRWDEARKASRKAVRFDTQDPRIQYHAGIIALHFGRGDEAKNRLGRAVELNAHFHPIYADDARKQLAALLAEGR